MQNCSGGNCSSKNDTLEGDCYHSTLALVLPIVYSVIAFLAITGNFSLIFIIIKKKEMHNVTNILIANLSTCDLLISIICLPFTVVYTLMDYWIFGEAMCKLTNMVQCVSVSVSVFTLVLIALERYQLIINPRGWRPSNLHAFIGIFVVWILAICIAIPLAIHVVFEESPLNNFPQYKGTFICHERWPSLSSQNIFTNVMLVVQYFGPLCFIGMCYLKIYIRLKRRNVAMETMRENKYRSNETKRINVLLISIVVATAVCWLPLHIFNIVAELIPAESMVCTNLWSSVCHLMAMISTCINPIFYGFLNRNLQQDLLIAFRFCRCSSREDDYETITMSTIQSDVSKTSFKLSSPEASKFEG
uniref:Neuropeptide Y receptor type 1 n=1 Tax=Erpetoichthys calabaricus TaxID=27687 RepID=A0A8C4XDU6_ERPCA